MSALTFSHLRSFCYSIEQDSQKLRKLSESKVSVEGDLEDATSFVKELRSEVSDVENETKLLEKYIFNRTEEKKVPYIRADEIVSRCELLLENNKSSMTMLKKHLQKYDHKCVSESTNTVSSSKGNLSNNNQNKENNENNNDNQLPPVVDAEQSNSCMNMDVDVDTIDLHSQHHEAADDHNIQSAFLFEQNSQIPPLAVPFTDDNDNGNEVKGDKRESTGEISMCSAKTPTLRDVGLSQSMRHVLEPELLNDNPIIGNVNDTNDNNLSHVSDLSDKSSMKNKRISTSSSSLATTPSPLALKSNLDRTNIARIVIGEKCNTTSEFVSASPSPNSDIPSSDPGDNSVKNDNDSDRRSSSGDEIRTPAAVSMTKNLNLTINSGSSTPETPNASTPFKMTSLQMNTTMSLSIDQTLSQSHVEDHALAFSVDTERNNQSFGLNASASNVSVSSSDASPEAISLNQSTLNASMAVMNINDNNNDSGVAPDLEISPQSNEESNYDSDGEAPTTSPLRLATLLKPREAKDESSWIPLIKESEFDAAPSFVRMQVKLDVLNRVIECVNEYIADHAGGTGSVINKRLETFTGDELAGLMPDLEASMKVVVIGLTHFKRLDVGYENSVKVYKVRRFY